MLMEKKKKENKGNEAMYKGIDNLSELREGDKNLINRLSFVC